MDINNDRMEEKIASREGRNGSAICLDKFRVIGWWRLEGLKKGPGRIGERYRGGPLDMRGR